MQSPSDAPIAGVPPGMAPYRQTPLAWEERCLDAGKHSLINSSGEYNEITLSSSPFLQSDMALLSLMSVDGARISESAVIGYDGEIARLQHYLYIKPIFVVLNSVVSSLCV